MFVENLLCSRHSGYVNSSLSLSSVFHLQSTSSLTDSLTNKTFISVHGFLPFLIYIYLVSLTSSNSILFFFDNSEEHSNRLPRALQGKWDSSERTKKVGNLWKLKACVSYTNSFPIMLYQTSRHTPGHPQTSASSDEISTDN